MHNLPQLPPQLHPTTRVKGFAAPTGSLSRMQRGETRQDDGGVTFKVNVSVAAAAVRQ